MHKTCSKCFPTEAEYLRCSFRAVMETEVIWRGTAEEMSYQVVVQCSTHGYDTFLLVGFSLHDQLKIPVKN